MLLLLIVVTAGATAGSHAGAAIRSGCESSLASGTPIRVSGFAREDRSSGEARPGGARRRISLEDAVLSIDGLECRVARIAVFTAALPGPIRAGQNISADGEWLRLRPHVAPGAALELPGRTGIVVDARLGATASVAPGTGGPGFLIGTLRRSLRVGAARRLRYRLPADVDPTARALVLAERDDLPGLLRRRFSEAGLAHLLAISGLHVGIVAGLAMALAAPIARGGARYLLAAGVVSGYVVLLGAPAPAMRASILFSGWALARRAGRPVRAADLLGLAALCFLVADPPVVLDPGFQLSFAGFAGVVLVPSAARSARYGGARRAKGGRWWHRCARALGTGLLAGGGAFLATAPISALHFGRIAPISVVSNLVGSPIVAGAIWGLAGALLPGPPGAWFAAGAAACLRSLHATAERFADLRGAHFEAAPPSPDSWLAWAIGFAVLGALARGQRPARVLVPAALAAALLLGQPIRRFQAHTADALLCTLSVGQGDAAILRSFSGRWIVFDGGPDVRPGAGRETVTSALRRRRARSVALVVLSHPDQDHLGGLAELMATYRVGAVLDTGDPLPRSPYARLLALGESAGVPWILPHTGSRVRVDEVELLVLAPDSSREPRARPGDRTSNETSLIVRADIAGFRYLNPGDATMEGERRVLEAWPERSLRADLLKVGHHGSRTSTSDDWLAAVRPRLAVISAGLSNRYGHPHAEVLRRLSGASVPRVWRTDRSGTLCIEIRRDGAWRIEREFRWIPAAATPLAERHGD